MPRPPTLALALGLAASAATLACNRPSDDEAPPPAAAPPAPAAPAEAAAPPPAAREGTTWAKEVEALDETLAAVLRRAESQPKSWLALDKAAGLYLSRARLTGDYGDYAKAEQVLERAFAIAGEGAGPIARRIDLNFTLHRLDRVAADIERLAKKAVQLPQDARALADLRAELAFQTGDYEAAGRGFELALAADENVTTQARLALYRWKTGDFADAEALYAKAIAGQRGVASEPLAWLHLQLGLMDLERGRWDDALAHYRDADAVLAGYWLIEEHIAEILTLQGETEEARARYEDIVARTGNAEFMDALAGIAEAKGDAEAASQWAARARGIYEAQLARFPEAAYGHALDHFLDFGEPARAVELAEANHRTRPNAEAKLSLARAYLKAGRVADARAAVEDALKTRWNTADLHAIASEVLAAAGAAERAAEERAKALALNPRAFD